MILAENINRECIAVNSKVRERGDALHEIARLAGKSPVLAQVPVQQIEEALAAREAQLSTGIGKGFAIPHCHLRGIEDFVIGLLVAPDGVEFHSLDGKPTQVFFFIIAPEQKRNLHVRVLSSLSKLIQEEGALERFLKAENADAVLDIFHSHTSFHKQFDQQREICLLHIFVQQEQYFSDILQLLSAETEGSISVLESKNAGSYLHKLPLFASFWEENTRSFNRVIVAVVDKRHANEIVRRISTLVPELNEQPGVLVTVQDVSISIGSLDF